MSDDEWVVARVAHYAYQADAMRARLADSGIDVHLPEEDAVLRSGGLTAPGGMRVMVRPADRERAVNILDSMTTERPSSQAPHPGALRVYQEWAEHRLDPGHYLGGNIQPDLRIGELGPRARRRSALLIGISVVSGAVGLALLPMEFDWQMAPTIAMYTLMAAAAIRLASR